jgi:hypothetical protein
MDVVVWVFQCQGVAVVECLAWITGCVLVVVVPELAGSGHVTVECEMSPIGS